MNRSIFLVLAALVSVGVLSVGCSNEGLPEGQKRAETQRPREEAQEATERRIPPPEFDTRYVIPETDPDPPMPRSIDMETVDIAVLVVFLVVATVLALRTRRRSWIMGLTVLALLYFGFYRLGCVCPIGAIQNVAEGIAGGYAVPLVVVAFLTLPIIATLLFGRTFCGSVCPLGAVQEAVLVKPVRVPRWLEHGLGLGAYLYLGAAVMFAVTGTAYVICRYDPFVGLFRLIDLPAANASGAITLLWLTGGFVLLSMFIGRPYCRFLCPLGAIFRICSQGAWKHVTITPSDCVKCSLCEDSCPYNAIRRPTAKRGAKQRTAGRRRLVLLIVLAPILVAGGGVFGWWLSEPLAGLHRRVQLAELVLRREADEQFTPTDDQQDMLDGFNDSTQTRPELYAEADAVRADFAGAWSKLFIVRFWGGEQSYWAKVFVPGAATWFGVFAGLVVGVKLISLSVRRTRTIYEPDRALCVSCGRCFQACPVHRDTVGLHEGKAHPTCPHGGLHAGAAGGDESPSGPEV